RHRQAADARAARRRAAARERAAREAQARRAARQGGRARCRPAQAAAQDPHPRDRRRRAAADPLGRARGARRRRPQPAGPRRLAIRGVRPRRARTGRGQARLRRGGRPAQDDADRSRGRRGAQAGGRVSVYLPTIKQLQYLVALHEHGHFGRAADASNVSQSTLSAGIRELESLLGVTLVERSRRVVRFTPLGNAVVAKAHRVLREAEELADLVQASGKPLAGELRMSVIPTIAPFLLPRILPRLRKERPALKLFLREETSGDAVESLHHGRADCVLLALPFATG